MPVSLSQLQNRRKTVEIEYDTETVQVVYNPAAITVKTLQELTSGDDKAHALIRNLQLFMVDWDVEDGDGNKVPISAELLEELPIDFLVAISEGIDKDVQPGEAKGATSKGGSFSPA